MRRARLGPTVRSMPRRFRPVRPPSYGRRSWSLVPLALATALLAGSASASAATTAIDFEDPPADFGGCEPNCERWTLTAAGDLTTTASQVSVTVGFLGTGRETSHMRLMPATRPARRSSSTRPTSPRARRSPAA